MAVTRVPVEAPEVPEALPTNLKALEINKLFDDTIEKIRRRLKGIANKTVFYGEYHVFRTALGESGDTEKAVFDFLCDVRKCPQKVIEWCQEELQRPD